MTAVVPSLRLVNPYLKPGAGVNLIQLMHRCGAIEHAFAALDHALQANLGRRKNDPIAVEMESTMRDWVAETLLQGAYLREYHLWEKDCRAYFAAMAAQNATTLALKPKGAETFIDAVRKALGPFDIQMPNDVFCAIERMREHVNVMKHEAGLEVDHFITEGAYIEAMQALENFWVA